ncbi:MAG: ABC-2 transporter permease [Oscillospiraceae bacterium]|nr:ABC-2 transporter permease [Oscillospiraceae bacterium]
MKALLIKDCFVLWRQLRIFILVMLVITVFNGDFGNIFIVVWAAMLPYTAMAYDERSKWDHLAAMMPYSVRDIVLSKYMLGWLCCGTAALFSLLVQLVQTALGTPLAAFSPMDNLIGLCASLCVLSITLPLMFRFGVERGRLVMFLLIFLVCGTAGALGTITVSVNQTAGGIRGPFAFFMFILPAAAVVLTAVSIPLSMRLYPKRSC